MILINLCLMLGAAWGWIGLGDCPTVSSVPYNLDMNRNTEHYILYMNYDLHLLYNVYRFLRPFANDSCPNVGNYATGPLEYAASLTKTIYYDASTQTTLHYMCIDQKIARILIR